MDNTDQNFSFRQAPNLVSFPDDEESTDLLTVRSAGIWLQRASNRPAPRMLFGHLWYEGEVCILFADSNLGKSILAMQIAQCINTGTSMYPFTGEAKAQPVLYCDFELTEKQFEARYSNNYQNHFDFNDNFHRAELNPDMEIPTGFTDFDEYLIAELERAIVQTNARAVMVDNLTYLRNETEQAKNALPLMKHLKVLKNKYGLSILALAHTPKRDLTQAITGNDLQGSKMLMNFCDSAFTIGQSSKDKNLRYLKQIKQRNTEQVYGLNNVVICQIIKPDNFLQYEFTEFGNELDHLRKHSESLNTGQMDEAIALKAEGLSLREIGKRMDMPYNRVDRLIKAARKNEG